MAVRPIYVPERSGSRVGVQRRDVSFEWFPGLSVAQKKRSIGSLHANAAKMGVGRALEVSSKSGTELGVGLSAFNLKVSIGTGLDDTTVEAAFQGAKVFTNGGPYVDLLRKSSRDAKGDPRLRSSGELVRFELSGSSYSAVPNTFFYDWLYVNATRRKLSVPSGLCQYDGFTDIEFNPLRSLNCQAYSCALFVSLESCGLLDDALESPEAFLEIVSPEYSNNELPKIQMNLL